MTPDPFAVYSASLPLRLAADGSIVPHERVRPWNGRALSLLELVGCHLAAILAYRGTGDYGLAAQAAHEWLSEHAPGRV